MGRFLPLFLSLVGTLHVIGVSGDSAAECIGRCTGQIRDKFADLQCPDANAAPCFCKNPSFSRAILECSQACGATMDMISGYLTSDFCRGQELVKPTPSGAAAPAASPTQSSSSSPPPAGPVVSSTTTSEAAPPIPTPTPTSTSQVDSNPSNTPGISPSITATATPSSTPHASSSRTSDTAPSATSSAAAGAPSSPGLSQAAIAGIGTGIGAAVLAIIGFIICALMKGRKKNTGRDTDKIAISKPMPGSGRTYPSREDQYRAGRDASLEKFGPDIEMTANRYEDMVPRTQPRTMV
ncbi:hypothetical protein E4U54_005291 [Claviceps lovelessii]|nr:hypothetical protein E4U54_005291 [Claviceps lovelessii]